MTQDVPPFEASRIKLRRATSHIEALRGAVSDYFQGKPIALIVTAVPGIFDNGGHHTWVASLKAHPPQDISAIIGDAVHNMRSALDLLACDLVRLNGGSRDGVCFPFANSAKALDAAVKERHLDRASADVVRLYKSFKPFRHGNIALRGLHDLDIKDKHNAILPAVSNVKFPASTLITNGVQRALPEFESVIESDGQLTISIQPIANLPLGSEVPVTFNVVFDYDTPFPGDEIIPTLESLHDLVVSIVEAFATLCAGQQFLPEPVKPNPLHKGLIVVSGPDRSLQDTLRKIRSESGISHRDLLHSTTLGKRQR